MSLPARSPAAPPDAPHDATSAALRLVAAALGGAAVHLYREGGDGRLALAAAWGDAPDARGLAETLGPEPARLDVRGALDGVETAAGMALGAPGEPRSALVAFARPGQDGTERWADTLGETAPAFAALHADLRGAREQARLLCDIATLPGSFDDRLATALERIVGLLGMDASALALVRDGRWSPVAVYDPPGALVPREAVPVGSMFCAATVMADGPVGVPDGRAAGASRASSYLGAPLFAGGRCVGTLSVVSGRARAPFSDDERSLVEALARWAGVALAGREASVRLAEREATLAAFFDAVPLGMGTLDLVAGDGGAPDDLRLGTLNANAAQFFGHEAPALAGRLASDARLDAPMIARWTAACRASLATARPSRFEFVADGPRGPLAYAATVVGLDPAAARFSFVVEDVTAARRAQERLRQLDRQIAAVVDRAPVALFTATPDGVLVSVRGAALLGPDATPGASLRALYGGTPGADEAIDRVLCGHAAHWTARLGGRTVETYAVPDSEGTAGLHGVAVDVSDREKSLEAAAELRRVEASASEARRVLLSHVTHELRSPLSAVLGYADLLDPDSPPDEIAEVRDVVARAGQRMLLALDDLGALALVDAERVAVATAPMQPEAVLAAVVGAHRVPAAARRTEIAVAADVPPGPVLLDPALFERVARSLVGGAVAATAGGRVDVRLVVDGRQLVLDLRAAPANPDDGLGSFGADLVRRIVQVLDGTVDEGHAGVWRWTVRLPYRPVPLVAFGPEPDAFGGSLDGGLLDAAALDGEAQAVDALPGAH